MTIIIEKPCDETASLTQETIQGMEYIVNYSKITY